MHALLALLLMLPSLLLGLLPGLVLAQTIPTETGPIRAVTLARGLEMPWSMAFLPDGRLLVTERPGRLRIVARNGSLSAPLSGVPKVFASGQGGLLDVALDPDFANTRQLYLSYAEPGDAQSGGGAGTAVARGIFTDSGLQDVRVIFRQQPKVSGGLHFGSRLAFDRAGYLFIGLGERYQRDEAQNLGSHLGKLIRINRDGTVPPDNPFVNRAGALPEIFSYGHRNIQGMTLHPETGVLWLHEHGARGGDEINLPRAGLNYGWPVITHGVDYSGAKIGEGSEKPGMEQPLLHWTPSIAPAGMAFYAGDKFPAWRGNLFVGSLKFRSLHRVVFENGRPKHEEAMLKPLGETIRDVRAGPDGYLYIATDNPEGRIIRLEPAQ